MNNISIKKTTNCNRILEDYLNDVASNASEKILSNAQNNCPVDTGALKDSLQIVKENNKYLIATSKPYALFVEFGNRFVSPSGFLRRAFNSIFK